MSKKRKGYVPDRGEVVDLSFTPQAGHEQAGRRPALVISPKGFNSASGLCVVVPITNTRRGGSWEVPVPTGYGLTGVALAHQLKTLDWSARDVRFSALIGEEFVLDVVERALVILDPDNVFTDPSPGKAG